MSPTMWAVILTQDDGTIQASQCFPISMEPESQNQARILYTEWKDALICQRCACIE